MNICMSASAVGSSLCVDAFAVSRAVAREVCRAKVAISNIYVAGSSYFLLFSTRARLFWIVGKAFFSLVVSQCPRSAGVPPVWTLRVARCPSKGLYRVITFASSHRGSWQTFAGETHALSGH